MPNNKNKRIEPSDFIKKLEEGETSNFTISDNIRISEDNFPNAKKIEIWNCRFKGEFILNNVNNKCSISFIDCTFTQRLIIYNVNLSNLVFLRCSFIYKFDTKNLITKQYQIEKCIFNYTKAKYLNQFETKQFTFRENESPNTINIKPRKVSNVVIQGSEAKYSLSFSGDNKELVIDNFKLYFKNNNRTDFSVHGLKANKFRIHGILNDSSLAVYVLTVKTGILHNFSNFGKAHFNSIKPLDEDSTLVIKNCHLGNTTLSQTNYSLFERIISSNNNILEIIPVNITWCAPTGLSKNQNANLKELYRQLKIVASKNDDVPSKLEFQKHEMRYYLKLLKGSKGKFADKFVLWSNYISNNFGLNWFLALSWLIGLSIIWYTATKYYIGHTHFDFSLIGDEVGRFISFLNPAHKFDSVFGVKNYKGNAILFDGISRITNAYLLFQFISAFRKYGKK